MENSDGDSQSSLHDRHDARGMLIPDDICKNKDRILSNPEAFWSSCQFYVKGDEDTMLRRLSLIPDTHFCHIRSLCLDFGWHPDRGFVYGCFPQDQWDDPAYSASIASSEHPPLDDMKQLLDEILRQGSDNIIVKLLWTTSLSIPRQHEVVYENERDWEDGDYPTPALAPALFRDWFRTWGYSEDRVRLITRIQWRNNEFEDPNWEEIEGEKYEEYEQSMFEMDPDSGDLIWEEEGTSIRISYGLPWPMDEDVVPRIIDAPAPRCVSGTPISQVTSNSSDSDVSGHSSHTA
jgi:hypothetical protein